MKKMMKCGLVVALAFGLSVTLASAAGKMDMGPNSQMKMAPNHQMTEVTEGQIVCPIMGNKFTPTEQSPSYKYKGKTYQFCCPGCVNLFKKDPEKYLSRIKIFKVTAKKYAFVPAEIKVKQNDIVKIHLFSEDVTHSLAIKEYGINVPVNKGEVKKIEFLADKKGTFVFRCLIPCGPGHSGMTGKLIVE